MKLSGVSEMHSYVSRTRDRHVGSTPPSFS
jgi:hypothetical protein